MKHLWINLIIAALACWIWYGNRKLANLIKGDLPKEPTYSDLMYKLHLILEVSEHDIFQIAARESGNSSWKDHFKQYVKDGSLPAYMIEFLEDGREKIVKYQIKTWTH